MVIDGKKLGEMFLAAADEMRSKCDYLCEIDSKFGDGDHGITVKKIGDFIEASVNNWDGSDIAAFIEDMGDGIMGVNGGSAGPLYGTMIGGMSMAFDGEDEIDATLLKKMFESSLEEMQDITTAKVGEKTMMDALIPAVEAALASSDDIEEILKNAKEAALAGAKKSEEFVSKFGRAKSYKEQTIGTPDAGAVSTSLFFSGFVKPII